MISSLCARLATAVALAVVFISSTPVFADPRPLSEAETEAVRLVAAHLADGPSRLWDATTAGSRLRKLGREPGTQEIEIRVGPRESAEWELVTVARPLADSTAVFRVTFPSGADDTIAFSMQKENGAWRIADVRSMSDPVGNAPAPVAKQDEAPRSATLPLPASGLAAAALAVLCAAAAIALRKRARRFSIACTAVAAFAFAGAGAIVYLRHAGDARSASASEASLVRVSPDASRKNVVELRRKVAEGVAIPESEFAIAARDPEQSDRVELWSAQLAMQKNDLNGAAAALARLRRKNDTPLAKVIEGRIAFLQNRDVDAVMAFERAMELGPERDDVQYETASVLMTLGFEDRAEGYFRKLDELGSREADAYYSLAVLESMDDSLDRAETYLMRAYDMRPALRSSLVRMSILYELLRRPAVQARFALHRTAEPLVTSPRLSIQPMTIVPGTTARCIGDYLELELAGSTLRVPGGAFMAPAGVAVLSADAWDSAETNRVMNDLPTLARVASQPSSYAQPALSRRIEQTAGALVTHNRWTDLVALTAAVSPDSDLVPADLLLMKAMSLKHTGKGPEARALLEGMVAKPGMLKRLDARQLLDTGELLASVDAYALAIKLMDRAGQIHELPHLDDRVRQLSLNQQITKYASHQTAHFTIRYSEEMGIRGAQKIGEIAEAELVRLQQWIPVAQFAPVVINVISWETFRSTYTGQDHILGFYDGKITIPFAGVGIYPPEIVAILSHELAHAMIAQRTNEQAPRWFHEGLAQRIESVQYKANPFNMYDPDQMIAMSMLDDLIAYSPDPSAIGQGYIVSQALIRYIESRWGTAGINRFLDAFASGKTTEEAVAAAGAGSLAEFDEAFRAWGQSRREVFENTEVVSYEDQADRVVMRRKK